MAEEGINREARAWLPCAAWPVPMVHLPAAADHRLPCTRAPVPSRHVTDTLTAVRATRCSCPAPSSYQRCSAREEVPAGQS